MVDVWCDSVYILFMETTKGSGIMAYTHQDGYQAGYAGYTTSNRQRPDYWAGHAGGAMAASEDGAKGGATVPLSRWAESKG